MKTWRGAFNIYFLAAALGVSGWRVASAADSPQDPTPAPAVLSPKEAAREQARQKAREKELEQKKKKEERKHRKEVVTLRIHLEVPPDRSGRSGPVTVLRHAPMQVNIEKDGIVDESYLVEAKLIPTPGGPEIELQFDTQGRTALENYTAANRGRRLAVYTDFGEEHRWIAAPVITRLLSNGTFRFTPDASQEEAERIVNGLNRVAKDNKKKKEDF
jgi:preprotein translocase subunit SecD